MTEISHIDAIFLKWESEKGPLLIISCSRSKSISRLGDTSLTHPPSPIQMGKTDEAIFERLMDLVASEWFEFTGRYEFPNIQQNPQTLTIQFTGEEVDTGFEFAFGEGSEGPPEDILEFVEYAVELTEPWYQEKVAAKKQRK
ncbi:MAG: hypothetical protein AAF694_22345 [Bacteroidota bacterium]